MSRTIILSAILILANYADAQVIEYDDDEYYEQTAFPVWGGAGWYGGVYINNENEYWNHYNQHYSNQNNQRNDQNHGDQQNRGSDDRGGGGRGGGGHGGGGGHR